MNRVFASTRLILIGLFIVASSATAAYQVMYIWPMQKCEKAGAWWDGRDRQCLTPMPIWRLTGRLPQTPEAAKGR
ncbi:MAG: hypothetical protein KGL69_00620 [Alphaproteobacteria bacterium]|nr:hypothetical protein [Alphaproteobacteria bacterium]